MKFFEIGSGRDANFKMVAKTIFGLEEICKEELRRLGAENLEIHNRAVSFEGNLGVMYKANLLLRTALRVLVQFAEFEVHNEHDLYERVKNIEWENLISTDDTIAIDTVLNTEIFNHSQYISQKTKDAICDRFREKSGVRPSVDLDNPTLRLHLHVSKSKCVIALDSSGDSLHKRGYRDKTNLAPINEVLAAGLVQLSGWDRRSTFLDPMCGSGTILIEAAMLAANIPARALSRAFRVHELETTVALRQRAVGNHLRCGRRTNFDRRIMLYGIELSPHVARKAKENVKRSKTEDMIRIRNADFLACDPPVAKGKPILLMNPPYGERMDKEDIAALYKAVGDTFKQKYKGYECWVISSNHEALKHLGLSTSKRLTVYNGQLECRFFRYSVYEGSKKAKKNKPEE
jgi:putative N6-adenine-specific DNA methylase